MWGKHKSEQRLMLNKKKEKNNKIKIEGFDLFMNIVVVVLLQTSDYSVIIVVVVVVFRPLMY